MERKLKTKEELGKNLCEYCSLEKKNTYSVPGGFMAGCEGSRCDDAYDNYIVEEMEKEENSQPSTPST